MLADFIHFIIHLDTEAKICLPAHEAGRSAEGARSSPLTGVATTNWASVDPRVAVAMLISKAATATSALLYGIAMLRGTHGSVMTCLGHAAVFAMAASHSLDVALGVPICRELYPSALPYVYLNQTLQLIFINPLFIAFIELSRSSSAGSHGVSNIGPMVRSALWSTVTTPLVICTAAGLLAGRVFPSGLPAYVLSSTKLVADAGGCECLLAGLLLLLLALPLLLSRRRSKSSRV